MVPRLYLGALVLLVSSLAPSGVSSNSNAIIPPTNGKWKLLRKLQVPLPIHVRLQSQTKCYNEFRWNMFDTTFYECDVAFMRYSSPTQKMRTISLWNIKRENCCKIFFKCFTTFWLSEMNEMILIYFYWTHFSERCEQQKHTIRSSHPSFASNTKTFPNHENLIFNVFWNNLMKFLVEIHLKSFPF